jgi:hypothetical protein
MVNDTNTEGSTNTHDKFTITDWLANSRHYSDPSNQTYVLSLPDGNRCKDAYIAAGNNSQIPECQVQCLHCHDSHGGSNSALLREEVISPDRWRQYTVTNAVWGGSGTKTDPYKITVTIGPNSEYVPVQMMITGVNPVGYNGVYLVDAVVGNTVDLICAPGSTICSLAADPGAYVGGGLADVGRTIITGFSGLADTDDDAWRLHNFCRNCHEERFGNHNGGTLCTKCHYHGAGSKSL